MRLEVPKGIKLNILAENSQFQEENDPNEERDFDKQPTTMPYKADAKLISPHFKFLFEICIAIWRLRNQTSSCFDILNCAVCSIAEPRK